MQLFEIIKIALNSLRTNKLRSSLTILGIVVGIFSIISISTIIVMLQTSIEEGMSALGKNTFQLQKWPMVQTGSAEERALIRNRRNITVKEYWVDREGVVGVKGITYCYGGINKAGAEADGLNAFASKLKKDKIRMKFSKEAEEKLNRLIKNMYKRAAEIKRESSEQLRHILDSKIQEK